MSVKNRTAIGLLLLTVVGVCAMFGVLLGSGDENTILWTLVLALGLICGGLLLYSLKASWLNGEAFQPSVGIALVTFLGYGLGALHARYGVVSTAHGPVDPLPGLVMGLIATICFSLGYLLPFGRNVDGAALARWWPAWSTRSAFAAGLFLIGVGAIATAYYFANGEYFAYSTSDLLEQEFSTVSYFRELLFVGLTIAAISAYGRGGTRGMRRVTLAIAAISLAVLLPTGLRYYVLYVAAAVLLPRHFLRRRLKLWSVLVAMLLIVGIVYPIGEMYRRQYQSQAVGSQSFSEATAGVMNELTTAGPGGYIDFTFGPALGRVDLATPLAALQTVVPNMIDYQWGASFLPALLLWIPRFIWTDKPFYQYDNLLGRAEGLINPNDFRTSIKYSYVGELFLDFGWAGVVLGMVLYGLLFRLLFQFTTRRQHPIGILIYSVSLVTLWTVESALGPQLGRIVRDLITALVVLWIFGAFRSVLDPANRSAMSPNTGAGLSGVPATID
jgi:hypothetical protein